MVIRRNLLDFVYCPRIGDSGIPTPFDLALFGASESITELLR